MFGFRDKLKKIIGLHDFNTSKVVNMNSVFCSCNELDTVDVSSFDTSNVTDMSFMFNQCFKLRLIIGIKNFKTLNVTNMKAMFQECKELDELDLSNFNTSNVTDMSHMFNKCGNLKKIKGIFYFNTTKVDDMNNIFSNCKKLEYQDFFDISSSNIDNNPNKIIISLLMEEIKKNLNINNEINGENNKDSVIFISKDKKVNLRINYENYDIFSKLEKELYNQYPYLASKNISFFHNGDEINLTSTLEENGIKNGDIIFIKDFI